jgi:hypothetical protein
MYGRKTKWTVVLLLVGALMTAHVFLIPAKVVSACSIPCWYAGSYDNGYGVAANIDTPSSLTFANMPAGATESNWVSTGATPTWMQTGWYFDNGLAAPWSYVEYCVNSCGNGDRFFEFKSSQGWNNTNNYMIEFDTRYGATAWCAYINGNPVGCKNNIKAGPTSVQNFSEIHNSGFTPLKTNFSALIVKATPTYWQGQTLHILQNFPYHVEVIGPQSFKTYRGATYIPIVLRG